MLKNWEDTENFHLPNINRPITKQGRRNLLEIRPGTVNSEDTELGISKEIELRKRCTTDVKRTHKHKRRAKTTRMRRRQLLPAVNLNEDIKQKMVDGNVRDKHTWNVLLNKLKNAQFVQDVMKFNANQSSDNTVELVRRKNHCRGLSQISEYKIPHKTKKYKLIKYR